MALKPNIDVRLATLDDLDYVSQDGYISPEVVVRKIGVDEVFILLVNGQPAGYVRLAFLWSLVPYVALIHIEKAYQKMGLSYDLLSFVEEHLRDLGFDELYSSSQVDEPAPQAWHRHMGFVECGIISGINEGGIGEVFFKKRL